MAANPLAAINSVALAVGRFASLDEMLDYALRKVLEVVETEAGGLYLLDESKGELVLAVQHGLSEMAWRDFDRLPLGEGLSGRVAASAPVFPTPGVGRDTPVPYRTPGPGRRGGYRL